MKHINQIAALKFKHLNIFITIILSVLYSGQVAAATCVPQETTFEAFNAAHEWTCANNGILASLKVTSAHTTATCTKAAMEVGNYLRHSGWKARFLTSLTNINDLDKKDASFCLYPAPGSSKYYIAGRTSGEQKYISTIDGTLFGGLTPQLSFTVINVDRLCKKDTTENYVCSEAAINFNCSTKEKCCATYPNNSLCKPTTTTTTTPTGYMGWMPVKDVELINCPDMNLSFVDPAKISVVDGSSCIRRADATERSRNKVLEKYDAINPSIDLRVVWINTNGAAGVILEEAHKMSSANINNVRCVISTKGEDVPVTPCSTRDGKTCCESRLFTWKEFIPSTPITTPVPSNNQPATTPPATTTVPTTTTTSCDESNYQQNDFCDIVTIQEKQELNPAPFKANRIDITIPNFTFKTNKNAPGRTCKIGKIKIGGTELVDCGKVSQNDAGYNLCEYGCKIDATNNCLYTASIKLIPEVLTTLAPNESSVKQYFSNLESDIKINAEIYISSDYLDSNLGNYNANINSTAFKTTADTSTSQNICNFDLTVRKERVLLDAVNCKLSIGTSQYNNIIDANDYFNAATTNLTNCQ